MALIFLENNFSFDQSIKITLTLRGSSITRARRVWSVVSVLIDSGRKMSLKHV